MAYYKPIRLLPCYKDYLWGGKRLHKDFGKTDAPRIIAESWEMADLPEGQSVTEEGIPLSQLAGDDPVKFWGSRCDKNEFPIMVKLIDAAKDLSIQVHPSDLTAREDLGEKGKAEMWYIVDCQPDAYLYYGFSRQISREEFLQRAQDGTICEVLNRVPVHKGDVFYILPGTIHALCAGVIVAEFQQNSDTTFRVFDYNRPDATGHCRELHLERAAEVLDFHATDPDKRSICNSVETDGYIFSEIFSCQYFSAYSAQVRTEIPLMCDGGSFHYLLCVEGEGSIVTEDCDHPIKPGDSYFLPACMGKYKITGECYVLLSKC